MELKSFNKFKKWFLQKKNKNIWNFENNLNIFAGPSFALEFNLLGVGTQVVSHKNAMNTLFI